MSGPLPVSALIPAGAVALGDIINLRGLLLAVPLVAAVLLFGWWFSRQKRARRKKPGQYLLYSVPGLTAPACRARLNEHNPDDAFAYTLTGASTGGWHMHFTGHNPTGQMLDTLFLLQFEGEEPAAFSLTFVREAFGMREPVMSEALLDEFFAQKLGAVRMADPSDMVEPDAPDEKNDSSDEGENVS